MTAEEDLNEGSSSRMERRRFKRQLEGRSSEGKRRKGNDGNRKPRTKPHGEWMWDAEAEEGIQGGKEMWVEQVQHRSQEKTESREGGVIN